MELNPYLERLGHDLAAAAAAGGPEITRAADLLAGALDASARLCLLEALSDAAAEITGKLDSASVEVRLRGREVDFAVIPIEPAEPSPAPAAAATAGDRGDLTRITLRLQERLKQEVEQAATIAGLSVNSWLAETVANSVKSGPSAKSAPGRPGRRVTGYTKA
jgi:hypothetical protein